MPETTTITEVATNWGPALAILGAALAAALGGTGSVIGTQSIGKAASGVLSEKPDLFGKFLILTALPGSQGIYGLIGLFMVLNGFDIVNLTTAQGAMVLFACLPLAFTAMFSGAYQGKVLAAGANILAKNPSKWVNAMILAVMVETFAILGLLATILVLLKLGESFGV